MRTFVVFLFLTIACCGANLFAQSFRGLDKSPMDQAYFPDNFAHDRKEGQNAIVRVIYSRPQKDGREVFGKLVPYGKVWRTGANESTEILLYKDIVIGGKKLAKGTYSLFTIPGPSEWTIIFNSDLDYWGAYSYNQASDVLRVTASSRESGKEVDAFTIQFEGMGDQQGVMKLVWDTTVVSLPFEY